MPWCVGDTYTYDEALAIIEKYMDKMGIREYCTKHCRGYCCHGCYESEDACHLHEGRRIQCSMFICHDIQILIFTKAQRDTYDKLMRNIHHANEDFWPGDRFYSAPINGVDQLEENWKINKEYIDNIYDLDTDKAHDLMWRVLYLARHIEAGMIKQRKIEETRSAK